MANRQNYSNGIVVEQWSNATRAGDPPAGYTAFDAAGTVTTQRALTGAEAAELAAADAAAAAATNAGTLQQRAQNALQANANYLAVAAPTNAQVAAQVQLLTKECSALIRLLLGQLDSTAGT